MKKIVLLIMASTMLALAGCTTGVHSVASGNADECFVCFVSTEKPYDIAVTIDGTLFNLRTIEQQRFSARRDVRARSNELIVLAPGRHKVSVTRDGKEVYTKEIFVSATETKVIEL